MDFPFRSGEPSVGHVVASPFEAPTDRSRTRGYGVAAGNTISSLKGGNEDTFVVLIPVST